MTPTRARFPIKGVRYRSTEEVDALYGRHAWTRSTIGDALRAAAKECPDKIFLFGAKTETSFSELDRRSEILAASLDAFGLRPGDRALFQMGTIPDTFVAMFGCFKAGVLPVCTLPQHRELEIGQMAGLTAPRVFFVQADFNPNFDQVGFARQMAAQHKIEHVVVARGSAVDGTHSLDKLSAAFSFDDARKRVARIAIDPEDVAAFQLSGGSTGIPKIIPRFHAEYLAQSAGWAELHAFSRDDVCLWPLPLIHNAAVVLIVLTSVLKRCSIVLHERFEMTAFLAAIEQNRVTYAGSVGPIAARLLEFPDLQKYDLSSLRMFYCLDRADALQARVGVSTVKMYGITEGLLMSSGPAEAELARHETVGRPSGAFDEVRILVPGSEDVCETGQEGELCFKGPSSLLGYYNAPDINAVSFTRAGFFRSGDLAREYRIEGRSYYAFTGRLKDNISRGNEKFSAEEVERLITRHPHILDAKVVAMPDPVYGERACAFIIKRPGRDCPTTTELGSFLIGLGLAKYKVPERIETVDQFPETRVGKVDKKAMRDRIAQILKDEAAMPASSPNDNQAKSDGSGERQ